MDSSTWTREAAGGGSGDTGAVHGRGGGGGGGGGGTQSHAAALPARHGPVPLALVHLDSLVNELQFDGYDSVVVRAVLRRVRDTLLTAPAHVVSASTHTTQWPGLPLRRLAGHEEAKLEWQPPTDVAVTGSFMLRTMLKAHATVDVTFTMPPPCFGERDVKNHMYWDRRQLYLGHVASLLTSTGLFKSVKAEALAGDTSVPVLLLHPSAAAVEAWMTTNGTTPTHTATVAGARRPRAMSTESVGSTASAYTVNRMKAGCKTVSAMRIRLVPGAPPQLARPNTLRPAWNNVRHPGSHAGGEGGDASPAPATPHYNARVVCEMYHHRVLTSLHGALAHVPAATAALILLKAWARLRGYQRMRDGVSPLVLTAIVASLCQQRKLLPSMNTAQAVRTVFAFLADHDLTTAPIVLQPTLPTTDGGEVDDGDSGDEEEADEVEEADEADGEQAASAHPSKRRRVRLGQGAPRVAPAAPISVHKPLLAEFVRHYAVNVLLPCEWEEVVGKRGPVATIMANLAFRVTSSAAAQLRADAALTARAISPVPGGLGDEMDTWVCEEVFRRPVPPSHVFDRLIAVPVPPPPPSPPPPTHWSTAHACDQVTWCNAAADEAHRLLTAALGDRVTLLRVIPCHPVPSPSDGPDATGVGTTPSTTLQSWPSPDPLTWGLDQQPPMATTLLVGVVVDTTEGRCNRMVDRGPAPEDVAAARAFTHLWGPLSELRRFADGSITHAVVWDAAKLGGRSHARDAIVPLIVAHTLARHLGIRDLPTRLLHAGTHIAIHPHLHVPVPTASAPSKTKGAPKPGSGGRGGGPHADAASYLSLAHAVDGHATDAAWMGAMSHALPPMAAHAAAAAMAASDIGVVAPSLSLERALDAGGHAVPTTTITFTARVPLPATTAPAHHAAASACTTVPTLMDVSHTTGWMTGLAGGDSLPAEAATTLSKYDPQARGPLAAVGHASAVFDVLVSALKAMPGMPLPITSVSPITPGLRYTAMHPPSPHPLAAGALAAPRPATGDDAAPTVSPAAAALSSMVATRSSGPGGGAEVMMPMRTLVDVAAAAVATVQHTAALPGTIRSGDEAAPSCSQIVLPMEAVIQLESSGKWADDPLALASLRTAFLLKVKYGLSAALRGVVRVTVHPDHADVFLGGYLFRLFLHVAKELVQLERVAKRPPLARRPPHAVHTGGLASLALRPEGRHEEEEGRDVVSGTSGGSQARGDDGGGWLVVGKGGMDLGAAAAAATAAVPTTRRGSKGAGGSSSTPSQVVAKLPLDALRHAAGLTTPTPWTHGHTTSTTAVHVKPMPSAAAAGAALRNGRREVMESAAVVPATSTMAMVSGTAVGNPSAAGGSGLGVCPAPASALFAALTAAGSKQGGALVHQGVTIPPALAGNPFMVALLTGQYPLTPTQAGARLDALYLRGVALPRHHGAMHGLAQRFPAYPGAVRLAAMWLCAMGWGPEHGATVVNRGTLSTAAGGTVQPFPSTHSPTAVDSLPPPAAAKVHLADGRAAIAGGHAALAHDAQVAVGGASPHVPMEVVELTVAHVFLHPSPLAPPATPSVALLRWLHLLSTWPWQVEPLLVDVDGSGTPADRRALRARFDAIRRAAPHAAATAPGVGSKRKRSAVHESKGDAEGGHHGPAMYIVTPGDRPTWRPLWSAIHPSARVLSRLIPAAAASEAILTSALTPIIPCGAAASLPHRLAGIVTHPTRVTWPAAFAAPPPPSSRQATVTVSLVADVLSRVMVDGRSFGAVRSPLAAAARLVALPSEAARVVSECATAALCAATPRPGAFSKSLGAMLAHDIERVHVVVVGGVADTSAFTLPLYANMLTQSARSTLPGFDPIACFLAALRSRYGAGVHFHLMPPSLSQGRGDQPGWSVVCQPALGRGDEPADHGHAIAIPSHDAAFMGRLVSEMAATGAGLVKDVKLEWSA